MSQAKRVFLIVLDSLGAGAAPDAADFGDEGAHTLGSLFATGRLDIPNLRSMGIGNIDGLSFLGRTDAPIATVARMRELSRDKDTTMGHWEIAGNISHSPMPTFPQGFPREILDRLSETWGRGILCNKPYSGTAVINDYGDEHIKSGSLIVYTSADSVLQIAAHTDVVPTEQLYAYCRQAREIMSGDRYGVGRIIARPFEGESGAYRRTADRRDFSKEPPAGLLPEAIKSAGLDSIAVGKINDIFAGVGFTRAELTHSNKEGMEVCSRLVTEDFRGLCFVNLVDFDTLWGHRRDAVSYAEGLNEFDKWLEGFVGLLSEGDVLMITADHGCDPSFNKTTDHTREYTPFLMYRKGARTKNHGTLDGFYHIGATAAALLGVPYSANGVSMI